jgi:NADH:ubiquinone oxidoreductase subunit E
MLCGGIAAMVTLILLVDGIVERGRAARETSVIEQLEEAVLTDASIAPGLETARESQTERSVARQVRNRRLGWVLFVTVGLFLAAAKRAQALGGQAAPSFDEAAGLVTLGSGASLAARAAASPTSRPATQSADLDFVDEVVARQGSGREAAIPILQALQSHYRYLPGAALERVCELTEVTPADLAGVATFYSQFRRTPVGKHLVRICHGTACHVAGIGPITDELRRRLAIPESGDSDADMRFTLDPVNCLGCCSLAPVLMVDDQVAGRLTPTSACEALAAVEAEP